MTGSGSQQTICCDLFLWYWMSHSNTITWRSDGGATINIFCLWKNETNIQYWKIPQQLSGGYQANISIRSSQFLSPSSFQALKSQFIRDNVFTVVCGSLSSLQICLRPDFLALNKFFNFNAIYSSRHLRPTAAWSALDQTSCSQLSQKVIQCSSIPVIAGKFFYQSSDRSSTLPQVFLLQLGNLHKISNVWCSDI